MQNAHKLAVYSEARALAVAIYRLTAEFPPGDRFGLTQQMRRAAVSVGSNIAEGCGRKGGRALLPFLSYSIGSTNELAFQLELAIDLAHCTVDEADVVVERVVRTRRMLIRLAAAVEKRMSRGDVSPTTHHSRPTTPSSSPAPAPWRRASASRAPSP